MPRPIALLAALASVAGLAAPASADRRSTCFDGPPLVASSVWSQLATFSTSQDYWDFKSPLPKGTYGRCAVKEGALWDPKGRRLAKLHCGIEVERRGLTDHLGLEVGAPGRWVIERTRPEAGRSSRELVCTRYTGGARCQYENKGHHPLARYIVSGKLVKSAVLRGKAAERFFAPKRIKRIWVTMSCH